MAVLVDEIGECVREHVRQAETPELLSAPRANAERLHDAVIAILALRCRDRFHRSVLPSCLPGCADTIASMLALSSRAAAICAPRYLLSWDSG
jgi:hypothetical protein